MVRTRTGVLPCLWCELKGAPLYLGDSGDGDDKNYGTRLMEVLGADRSEGGATCGPLRERLAEIRAGCAQQGVACCVVPEPAAGGVDPPCPPTVPRVRNRRNHPLREARDGSEL
jgi:hypothetical protein